MTSVEQDVPISVPITDENLETGSLVKPSWVRPDKVATLSENLIRKRVGRLSSDTLDLVRSQLVGLIEDDL